MILLIEIVILIMINYAGQCAFQQWGKKGRRCKPNLRFTIITL